jgi:Fe-S cluster assembly scaffold protein SufB
MNTLGDIQLQARTRTSQPSTTSEDWRYVDVKRLDLSAARGEVQRAAPAFLADLDGIALGPGGHRLLGKLPTRCQLSVLEAGASVDPDWAQAVLDGDLQRSWSLDGPVIDLRVSGHLNAPLLVLDNGGRHRLRLAITAGSSLDLILVHHLAAGELSCSGIDLELAEGAVVRVDEFGLLDGSSQLLADRMVRLARDARLNWVQCGCGAAVSRHSWLISLAAEGAEARLAGAMDLRGERQAHQYLRVRHLAPNTTSDQCFRCVAHDQSRSSFDGLVYVAPGCEGAHAEQRSGNLQLSPRARIFVRPQLDIQCDDVVASHGAAIGQPDAGEQFYLRSRGIDQATATQLVIRGFTDDIVNRFHSQAIKGQAAKHPSLSDWLKT